MQAKLSIRSLAKSWPDGSHALHDITFDAAPGERIVVLGPNGSGKSTLLRCLNGLERFDSGSIHVEGQALVELRRRELRWLRRRVGMVFQRFGLVGPASVLHNVIQGGLGSSGGPHYWWPATAPTWLREQACTHLERVGLDGLAGQRTDRLSGGQQQRVAIARLLMQDPGVILGDEPVANLDPTAARETMDLLWEVAADRERTVICVLHQVDLALEYADRIIALRDGRIVQDRPAAQFDQSMSEALYGNRGARGTGPAMRAGAA